MNLINVLFTVTGRINRAKWWLAVVLWSVVWTIALGAFLITAAQDIAGFENLSPSESFSLVMSYGVMTVLFILLIMIPMIVSSIFVGIKRLHDRDKSGWWLALFYLAPVILQSIGESLDSGVSFVFAIASFGIAIWGLVELGFLRGTSGPNQYGPDPLMSEQPAAAVPVR